MAGSNGPPPLNGMLQTSRPRPRVRAQRGSASARASVPAPACERRGARPRNCRWWLEGEQFTDLRVGSEGVRWVRPPRAPGHSHAPAAGEGPPLTCTQCCMPAGRRRPRSRRRRRAPSQALRGASQSGSRSASAAAGAPAAAAAGGGAPSAAIAPLQHGAGGPAAAARAPRSLLGRRPRAAEEEPELHAPDSPPPRPWRHRADMRRSPDAGTGWSDGEQDACAAVKCEAAPGAGRARGWRAASRAESSGERAGSHCQVGHAQRRLGTLNQALLLRPWPRRRPEPVRRRAVTPAFRVVPRA